MSSNQRPNRQHHIGNSECDAGQDQKATTVSPSLLGKFIFLKGCRTLKVSFYSIFSSHMVLYILFFYGFNIIYNAIYHVNKGTELNWIKGESF